METHRPRTPTEQELLIDESEGEGPRFPTSAVSLMSSLVTRGAKQRRLTTSDQGDHDDFQEDAQAWKDNESELRIRELENNNHVLRREINQLRFQLDSKNSGYESNGSNTTPLSVSMAQVTF